METGGACEPARNVPYCALQMDHAMPHLCIGETLCPLEMTRVIMRRTPRVRGWPDRDRADAE